MARFQPSHMSISNRGAPTRQLARRNGGEIGAVASSQVRTGSDMGTFIDRVEAAIEEEVGYVKDPGELVAITGKAAGTNDVKVIAPLFARLRKVATDSKATQTDQAILKAAAWYYNNVEKPALGQSSSSSRSSSSSSAAAAGAGGALASPSTPFYQATWFKVAAPLTAALLLGGLIIFWPENDDEPRERKPKRKVVMKEAKGKRVERKPSQAERARRREVDEFLGSSDDTGLTDGMYGEDDRDDESDE